MEKLPEDMVLSRYDHNCVSYKGNMLVYGGSVLSQALGNKPKEYLSDVIQFNLKENKFSYLNVSSHTLKPRPRKNAVADTIGDFLVRIFVTNKIRFCLEESQTTVHWRMIFGCRI